MNDQQALREADRAQANRDELTQRIAQAIRHDGTIEPLKGLHFNRSSSPSECVDSVSSPAFCAITQGSKQVLLGSDRASVGCWLYLFIHSFNRTQRRFEGMPSQSCTLNPHRISGNTLHDIEFLQRRLKLSISRYHLAELFYH